MSDDSPRAHGATTALLSRWHAGDATALDELLRVELPFVRRLAVHRLGKAAGARFDASDCVQEAVVDFLRYGPKVLPADQHQLRGLLARIVENNLRDRDDWFRARRRDAAREQPLDAVLTLDAGVRPSSSPSAAASRSEERASVRLALELLDARDRRVVIRRDWDRASFAEIGAELGIDENAARSRWVRAVGRLADHVLELRSGRLGQSLRAESVELAGDGA